MALPSTRMEYRIALHHLDRGVERSETVIVSRHPSETAEHLTLRVLTWCVLNEERLTFGPGLSTPDAPDLMARDLTGRLTTWVECGAADARALQKVVQHNRGIAAHAVFSEAQRRDELLAAVASWGKLPRGWDAVTVWSVEPALVDALAAREDRRQRWQVTIVGDHLYVDADGITLDGAVTRG